MPLPTSSRIALRRSRRTRLLLFSLCGGLLVLLLPARPIFSQSIDLHAHRRGDGLFLSATVADFDGSRLIANVSGGLSAEVVFVIRLYEEADGLAGALGDVLVVEYAPSYVARQDLFRDGFVVEHGSGAVEEVGSSAELLETILTLREYWIPLADLADPSRASIRVQARIREFLLAEPLAVVAWVIPNYTRFTPWVEAPVVGATGAAQ